MINRIMFMFLQLKPVDTPTTGTGVEGPASAEEISQAVFDTGFKIDDIPFIGGVLKWVFTILGLAFAIVPAVALAWFLYETLVDLPYLITDKLSDDAVPFKLFQPSKDCKNVRGEGESKGKGTLWRFMKYLVSRTLAIIIMLSCIYIMLSPWYLNFVTRMVNTITGGVMNV